MKGISRRSDNDSPDEESARYLWIESERGSTSLGSDAICRWIRQHWCGYLRARWLDHLLGRRFWVELDRTTFGLMQRLFPDRALLLDRVFDRLAIGQANLDLLAWAQAWGLPLQPVVDILQAVGGSQYELLCASLRASRCPLPSIDPAWLAWDRGTIPRIAQAIAAEGRFEDLPILADALEEAGCDDEELLQHCRAPGLHGPWCWVLDLLSAGAVGH